MFFANANFVTSCQHLRLTITKSPDLILLNDGFAVDLAALLRFGAHFPENLNGTDFTPEFLSRLDQEAGVFLLGGRPSAVKAAAEVLGRLSHVRIAGYADGYSIWDNEVSVVRRINHAQSDILLVAFGNPLQEKWILHNRANLNVPVILAVGGLFDFVSGCRPRAPQVLRTLRLEWAYRLALEPRRLVSRYTIGIARFFAAAFINPGKR